MMYSRPISKIKSLLGTLPQYGTSQKPFYAPRCFQIAVVVVIVVVIWGRGGGGFPRKWVPTKKPPQCYNHWYAYHYKGFLLVLCLLSVIVRLQGPSQYEGVLPVELFSRNRDVLVAPAAKNKNVVKDTDAMLLERRLCYL